MPRAVPQQPSRAASDVTGRQPSSLASRRRTGPYQKRTRVRLDSEEIAFLASQGVLDFMPRLRTRRPVPVQPIRGHRGLCKVRTPSPEPSPRPSPTVSSVDLSTEDTRPTGSNIRVRPARSLAMSYNLRPVLRTRRAPLDYYGSSDTSDSESDSSSSHDGDVPLMDDFMCEATMDTDDEPSQLSLLNFSHTVHAGQHRPSTLRFA